MQTFPCGHRVVCRKCFVKTIQMVVSQRMLPLRCVICRAKVLRLKQTTTGGLSTGFVRSNSKILYQQMLPPHPSQQRLARPISLMAGCCLQQQQQQQQPSTSAAASPLTEVFQAQRDLYRMYRTTTTAANDSDSFEEAYSSDEDSEVTVSGFSGGSDSHSEAGSARSEQSSYRFPKQTVSYSQNEVSLSRVKKKNFSCLCLSAPHFRFPRCTPKYRVLSIWL